MKKNTFYLLLFIATGSIITFFFTSFSPISYPNPSPPVIFGKWEAMAQGTSSGAVLTLAPDRHGNLFVGGRFQYAGGEVNPNIAKWKEGNQWAFNPTSGGFNDDVYSLVVNKNDDIFAVGSFNQFGFFGDELNHIAMNHSINIFPNWEGLDEGATNSISSSERLTTDIFGNIYLSGTIIIASTENIAGLAKWDGDNWGRVCERENIHLVAMTTDRNGIFYGVTINNQIISCDGEQWDTLGAANHTINDIAIDTTGNVIIIGGFSYIENTVAPGIAKWNGNNWEAINTPNSFNFDSILEIDGNNNLYASRVIINTDGFFHHIVEKWDGNTWQQLGNSLNSYINDLAIDTFGNFYVGGDFTNLSLNQIAKFSERVKPFPTYSAPEIVSTNSPSQRALVEVYPNPVNTTLHLKGIANTTFEVSILNQQGISVLNTRKGKHSIDISNLSPGLYFLHIKQGKGEQVRRFFKE